VRAVEVPALEQVAAAHGVNFLLTGVRSPATRHRLGRNYAFVGVRTSGGWQRFEQDKHHRWRLDGGQIHQYHLCRALDPHRDWWEAIDIPPRNIQFLDVGEGAITAALVCEDLARMDTVADVLRLVGPTLVVALLLDGPQLSSRWPCRYAAVLSDDPGSAVLTLTSLGMVNRSRPAGLPTSRVVALWNSPVGGMRPIELSRGAAGILLRAVVAAKTVWTADGRCHPVSTPDVVLTGVHQLRMRSSSAPRARPAARPGARTTQTAAAVGAGSATSAFDLAGSGT
jgi:hypothetical protein